MKDLGFVFLDAIFSAAGRGILFIAVLLAGTAGGCSMHKIITVDPQSGFYDAMTSGHFLFILALLPPFVLLIKADDGRWIFFALALIALFSLLTGWSARLIL